MRQISTAYKDAALTDSLEPVFVAKLINANVTVYLTTDTVTIIDVGSEQLQGVIKSSTFSSQSIKPEAGISSIGSMNISFDDSDRAFNDILTTIENADGSIYNDKVELYVGFKDIDFADYVLVTPLYVRTFTPDEINYTLKLTDIQRITEKSLFADPIKTELVGTYGYNDTSTIGAISTANYPLVEHNSAWAVDPGQTIGYLKAFGISKDGREVKEIISYTGSTPTEFTGVQRSRMGSERIDLASTDSSGNPVTIELIEMVYIDLVNPAMLLALLTGDLYGQVGKTLPDNWNAGIDASLINTVSFDEIGGELWQEHIEFRDLDTEDAKDFIADQVLAPYGVFLRVDQNGQYELARYDYVSQQSAGSITLTYDQIISATPPVRDAQGIKNFFQVDWGWRVDNDYYARHDFYIDGNSQTKHKVESDLETIQLRGLRNRDKNSKPSLDFIAQSLVKRKANPKVTRTVTVLINAVLELEVGDLVTLIADNEPDFRTGGSYTETFEVQSVGFDFLAGTARLKLFASEGIPSQFIVANGSNVASIGHSGWTDLDGSGYGINDAGTFKFNDAANIADGKYYFDGDIELPASRTITANESVYIDCDNVYLATNTLIDCEARGVISDSGYFGGGSTSQGGVITKDTGLFSADRIWFRGNESVINNARSYIDIPDVIRVVDGQQIDSLIPSKLYGMAGGAGGDNSLVGIGPVTGGQSGGASAPGGAGLFFSCTGFQYESSARIVINGASNNHGDSAYRPIATGPYAPFDQYFHAGSSGYGRCGVCIVALKDLGAAKPFLYDLVEAKSGDWSEPTRQNPSIPLKEISGGTTNKKKVSAAVGDYYPKKVPNSALSGIDYATESNRAAIKVINLVIADDQVNDPAIDEIDTAPAPSISYVKHVNSPRTQLGDQVTYELTAANDSLTKYVQFEYRLLPNGDFNPAQYKLTNESTIQETGTGDTYEIRATAYNFASKPGGVSVVEITFPVINRDSDDSDGGEVDAPDDITLPNIRGLELINSIDNDDGWNQWKSPNAEFKWLKMSNTLPASVSNINGVADLHLDGYKIRVTDTSGNIVREELVRDSFYTYTYDENKKDNPTPIREFKFEVQAVATTGYASDYVGFTVENPEPAAPSNVAFAPTYNAIGISFTLPNDVDFVGIDAFIIAGSNDPYTVDPVRISGNSPVLSDLISGDLYTIGLRSVDQFGTGGQIAAVEITTIKIQSVELGDIKTPITIDEVGGRFVTNNTGYIMVLGALNVPAESASPLMLSANNGVDYPFWINSNGNFSFGIGESYIKFDGSNMLLGRDVGLSGVKSFLTPNFFWHDYADEWPIIQQNASVDYQSDKRRGMTFKNSQGAAGRLLTSADQRISLPSRSDGFDLSNDTRAKVIGTQRVSNGGSGDSGSWAIWLVGKKSTSSGDSFSVGDYGFGFRIRYLTNGNALLESLWLSGGSASFGSTMVLATNGDIVPFIISIEKTSTQVTVVVEDDSGVQIGTSTSSGSQMPSFASGTIFPWFTATFDYTSLDLGGSIDLNYQEWFIEQFS